MTESMDAVLVLTDKGLFCPAGDFYVDPWPRASAPAERAIITHGHADHARPHSLHYLSTSPTAAVMRARLQSDLAIDAWNYGDEHRLGGARVSLHPAGHVLGSAQVRIEVDGETWVVSGDYKRDPDPTCAPFEVVPCDTFITEATFALPAYRWRPATEVVGDIYAWWQGNAARGRSSVLFCYAFGKVQRVLSELTRYTRETVYLHGAMLTLCDVYREFGIDMLPTEPVRLRDKSQDFSQALIVAPPSAAGSPWMRRFKNHSTGFVSGRMRVRGNRRRRGYDRGFVMSDHADWPSLLRTVEETAARKVLITHGESYALARYLVEQGVDASALETPYGYGDMDEAGSSDDGIADAMVIERSAQADEDTGTP